MSSNFKITANFRREEFSRFVYENPNTSIFQTLEMAEVYKRNKGCYPLTLAVINEDTGEIMATLLAKILEEKPGFLGSFSRHSTIRGGPIFVDSKEGIEAVSLLLRYYNNIIKNEVLYSRIYPLNDTPQVIPCFKENGYEYGIWNNFLIDLNRPVNEIRRDIDKYKRKNINRASKKGVYIEEITEKSLIPVFYDLLKETYTNRKQPLEDISYFKAVFDILLPKKMAKFFVAKFKDEYIATRLVLTYKGVVYDWHTGASRKFLSLYPNDLLVWHILKWGAENNFHTFDFGGGGTSDDLNAGWVRFKRKFGGKMVSYGRYTKIHQPIKFWLAEKAFKLYKLYMR